MRIAMFTNSYVPTLSGVTRSIVSVRQMLLDRGNEVLVVAPQQQDAPRDEPGVIRMPSIPPLTANEIPVALPLIGFLTSKLDEFEPTVIHAHHPFFLGNTALRVGATRNLPVLFTHHTMYEYYAHYLPGIPEAVAHLASRLATEFANRCHTVIAPSESVAEILRQRGVATAVKVIPTGIDTAAFARGDRAAGRRRSNLRPEALVVGYVGRLAAEKNLDFLLTALATALDRVPDGQVLIVGDGPIRAQLQTLVVDLGIADRVRFTGALAGQELADAYRSLDVFAFCSQSETQGMVLAEAMAAGVPVVALDAVGAREIVRDGVNGHLVARANPYEFAASVAALLNAIPEQRERLASAARQSAQGYSLAACTDRLMQLYRHAQDMLPGGDRGLIAATRRRVAQEMEIWSCWGRAGIAAACDAIPGTAQHESGSSN
jgi:1,2-diacylglycerol 3-alpha-glucosyltransferase